MLVTSHTLGPSRRLLAAAEVVTHHASIPCQEPGVISIRLLSDWKDTSCPGKERVDLLMADATVPYARRSAACCPIGMCSALSKITLESVQYGMLQLLGPRVKRWLWCKCLLIPTCCGRSDRKRYCKKIKIKQDLPGKLIFDKVRGWLHVLELDDELHEEQLDAEDVGAEAEAASLAGKASPSKNKHMSLNRLRVNYHQSLKKIDDMQLMLRERWDKVEDSGVGTMPVVTVNRTPSDALNFHGVPIIQVGSRV